MHTYIHTYIHSYIYTYVNTYLRTYVRRYVARLATMRSLRKSTKNVTCIRRMCAVRGDKKYRMCNPSRRAHAHWYPFQDYVLCVGRKRGKRNDTNDYETNVLLVLSFLLLRILLRLRLLRIIIESPKYRHSLPINYRNDFTELVIK